MRDFWTFIKRCLRFSFSHSWSAVDYGSTSSGVAVGFVLWKWGSLMSQDIQNAVASVGGWMIPVGAAALVTVIRIVLSPFWAWQEMKNERDILKAEGDVIRVYFVEEQKGGKWSKDGLVFRVVNKTDRDVYVSEVDLFGITSNGKEEAISYESSTLPRDDFWKPPIDPRNSAIIIFHITMNEIRARGYKQFFAIAFLKDDSKITGERLGITPPSEQAPHTEAPPLSPTS